MLLKATKCIHVISRQKMKHIVDSMEVWIVIPFHYILSAWHPVHMTSPFAFVLPRPISSAEAAGSSVPWALTSSHQFSDRMFHGCSYAASWPESMMMSPINRKKLGLARCFANSHIQMYTCWRNWRCGWWLTGLFHSSTQSNISIHLESQVSAHLITVSLIFTLLSALWDAPLCSPPASFFFFVFWLFSALGTVDTVARTTVFLELFHWEAQAESDTEPKQ